MNQKLFQHKAKLENSNFKEKNPNFGNFYPQYSKDQNKNLVIDARNRWNQNNSIFSTRKKSNSKWENRRDSSQTLAEGSSRLKNEWKSTLKKSEKPKVKNRKNI